VNPQGTVKGAGAKRKWLEATIWKWWRRVHVSPGLYRFAIGMAAKIRPMPAVGVLRIWSRVRSVPQPARKNLHQLMRERGQRS
jgi:L-lactate dehydrogenase complex protein LldF